MNEVIKMDEIKPEQLQSVYAELCSIVGLENVLQIYSAYKGQQVSFPQRLFSKEYITKQIMKEYRTRLEEKIQEILGDRQIDDARIATEVTIYADKVCVDEETVRLRSHIMTTKDTLLAGGSIGRKLDFIAQEMNREANTILSKANNIEISDIGIDLKTGIEKVREQIQNIE